MKEPKTPCDFAKMSYQYVLTWRNLWTILLYGFGVVVVLFSVAAILLFIRSTWLPAALTTLGTIVSGAGITWVVNQRKTAVAEEQEAFKRLDEECKQPGYALAGIDKQPWFRELQSNAWKSLKMQRTPSQGRDGDT